jgi:hypothetical protein
MRRARPGLIAAAAAVVVLSACGSSSRQSAVTTTTNTTRTTHKPTTTKKTSASGSTTAPTIASGPEISPSGDIPDNQAFVKYAAPSGAYVLQVPEGWARTGAGSATTFADHFNSIRVDVAKRAGAPTVASARNIDVPAIQRAVSGFNLDNVTQVSRNAGPAVLVTYRAESAADPVTGKRVALAIERYEFWHNGTSVTLTLSAPQGSDNVDPWRKVTDSLAWSA